MRMEPSRELLWRKILSWQALRTQGLVRAWMRFCKGSLWWVVLIFVLQMKPKEFDIGLIKRLIYLI